MSRHRSLETIESADQVSIGELVRLTGARYSTLKFYAEEGMLPFEQADKGLTRRYPKTEAVRRLGLIQELKAQGQTIPQIKDYLATRGQP